MYHDKTSIILNHCVSFIQPASSNKQECEKLCYLFLKQFVDNLSYDNYIKVLKKLERPPSLLFNFVSTTLQFLIFPIMLFVIIILNILIITSNKKALYNARELYFNVFNNDFPVIQIKNKEFISTIVKKVNYPQIFFPITINLLLKSKFIIKCFIFILLRSMRIFYPYIFIRSTMVAFKISLIYLSYLSFFKSKKCKTEKIVLDHNFGNFHLPLILAAKKCNIVTQIHAHGIFFEKNLEIFPLLENRYVVLSQREKDIILSYSTNIMNTNILVKGVNDINNTENFELINYFEIFDFCILGTYGELWYTDLIFEPLKKFNFVDYKILLRPHPYEPNNKIHTDIVKRDLNGLHIISCNKELIKDIKRSRIILSSSMDSIRTALLLKKPTIYFGNLIENPVGLDNIIGFKVVRPNESLQDAVSEFLSSDFNNEMIIEENNLKKIFYAFG